MFFAEFENKCITFTRGNTPWVPERIETSIEGMDLRVSLFSKKGELTLKLEMTFGLPEQVVTLPLPKWVKIECDPSNQFDVLVSGARPGSTRMFLSEAKMANKEYQNAVRAALKPSTRS
jgi:hypothetical protein